MKTFKRLCPWCLARYTKNGRICADCLRKWRCSVCGQKDLKKCATYRWCRNCERAEYRRRKANG